MVNEVERELLLDSPKKNDIDYGYAAKMSLLALFIAGLGFVPAVLIAYNSAVYHGAGDLAGETGYAPDANFVGGNDPFFAGFLTLSTCYILAAITYQYASNTTLNGTQSDLYKNKRANLLCAAFAVLAVAGAYGTLATLFNAHSGAVSEIGYSEDPGLVRTLVTMGVFFAGGAISAMGATAANKFRSAVK